MLLETYLRLSTDVRDGRAPLEVRPWLYRVASQAIMAALAPADRNPPLRAPRPGGGRTDDRSLAGRGGVESRARRGEGAGPRGTEPRRTARAPAFRPGICGRGDRGRHRSIRAGDTIAADSCPGPRPRATQAVRGRGIVSIHDAFQELAAASIDFELDEDERAELDRHLGECVPAANS